MTREEFATYMLLRYDPVKQQAMTTAERIVFLDVVYTMVYMTGERSGARAMFSIFSEGRGKP